MSDSEKKLQPNNPNAPNISSDVYLSEKSNLAGIFVCSILYGVVVVVAFKCMTALFHPAYRRGEGIKWGFVCYTMVMFSLVTVLTGINLDIQSICYIDNRDFPGADGMIPPGPSGYEWFIAPSALNVTPNVMFALCNWLADGLLLYRCYVIYNKNLWVIAFPCLMYLGSVGMGIMLVYVNSELAPNIWASLGYLSISFSLNVLLTLMIVIRLILHVRNTRGAVGISGIGGFSKAIVIMLVESCALYAVSTLLVLGSVGAGSSVANFFVAILPQTQVIAPLLIIQRVASGSAMTSSTITSRHLISFEARNRGVSTGGSVPLPGGVPISSVDSLGVGSSDLGDETTNFPLDEI